jgi:hypothetical protein
MQRLSDCQSVVSESERDTIVQQNKTGCFGFGRTWLGSKNILLLYHYHYQSLTMYCTVVANVQ